MFDQLKTMGALAGLLKNKDKIQEAIHRFQESLEGMSATGSAGSGAVKVTVTGKMKITRIQIDPTLAAAMGKDAASRSAGESLITEAANDAMQTVQGMVRSEANRQAQALGLPELPGLENLLG
ncbi:MAG: YbaB/EbfC family nucleoid-associated protein [Planctomycetes bacterium]|nr:YbaB/EbfC family nucleoid-associated protein [Planctomycetota bacterium]